MCEGYGAAWSVERVTYKLFGFLLATKLVLVVEYCTSKQDEN